MATPLPELADLGVAPLGSSLRLVRLLTWSGALALCAFVWWGVVTHPVEAAETLLVLGLALGITACIYGLAER